MAAFNLTIKDALLVQEVEAIAQMGGWTAEIQDPANPELTIPNITKEQFAKKQVKAWMRNQAVEHANRVALASVSVEEDV